MSQTQLRVGVLGSHQPHEMLAGERRRALTPDTLQLWAGGDDALEGVQDDGRAGHEGDALDGAEFEPRVSEVFPAGELVGGVAEEHE